MFFKNKNWQEKWMLRFRIRMFLKVIVSAFFICSFSYFILETLDDDTQSQQETHGSYFSKIEDIQTSFYSENNQTPLALPEQSVSILPNEFDADLAAQKMLGEAADVATINDIELDKIEETYEEELPEDIFEDVLEKTDEEIIKEQGEDYHIYHNHKKAKNVMPSRRPYYFGERPVIAIVIDDMGVSPKRTKDIISLPAPISASFLTYVNHLDSQVKAAQEAGHEIMIHVPMQAKTNKDAAPDVLKIDMPKDEVQKRLEIMIQKFPNVKGINNHMGSLFTENSKSLGAVMEVLRKHNLFFLDSKTSPKSVGRKQAEEYGVVYTHRHVFLDNKNDVSYILNQLKQAEKIAERNGYAVAIGHPKSGTYQALKQWIPEVKSRGIELIPMSKVAAVLGVPQQN